MNENTSSVKVGDLFLMSWGYDQTNVNYFQVVRTTPKGVFVREVGYKSVEGSGGFMCENVQPVKDNFLSRSQWCGGYSSNNPETFRKLKWSDYSKKWYFNFVGRYFAHPVSENSETYRSWYA